MQSVGAIPHLHKSRKGTGIEGGSKIMSTETLGLKKYDNAEREIVFNQALDRANVVTWKRAATVAKECKVSHATASGWLQGCLPRDVHALLRVRDLYNVDVDEWVRGEMRSTNGFVLEKVARAVGILRKYQETNDVKLEDEQYATLLSMLYENSEQTEFLLNNRNLLA